MNSAGADLYLLRRYQQSRDAEAFSELIGRHQNTVYSVCLRVLGNSADAEDATQKCFLQLALKAGAIEDCVAGWLHQCATRMALNARRQRISLKKRELKAADRRPVTTGDQEKITWEELAPDIDKAIASLPPDVRHVVVEHFFNRRSLTDISMETGQSLSTVSRRANEGINKIRENLKKLGVCAPLLLLPNWMSERGVTSAPPSLTRALAKIAISGVGVTGGIAGISVLIKLGVAAAAICVTAIALSLTWFARPSNSYARLTPALTSIEYNDFVTRAGQGDVFAIDAACYASLNGFGCKCDFNEARRWLKIGVAKGAPVALLLEGQDQNGEHNINILKRNPIAAQAFFVQASTPLRKYATSGDIGAMYFLGICEVEQERKENGLKWMLQAAEKGFPPAYGRLGSFYLNGTGVQRDPEKAVMYFQKGADLGIAWAQEQLGECMSSKLFNQFNPLTTRINKDDGAAVSWFKKAANQADPSALYCLGFCYEAGRGIDKDMNRAIECYKESAKQEHAVAYYALGTIYLDGGAGSTDLKVSVNWLDAAVCLDPDNFAFVAQRGIALDKLGQSSRAIEDYNRAIEIGSEWGIGKVLLNRGLLLNKLGRVEDALSDFERASGFKEDKDSAVKAFVQHGNLLFKLARDKNRELADYNAALHLDSNCAEAYYGRGHIYDREGKYAAAISDFDNALRCNVNWALAYSARGRSQFGLEHYDAAMIDLNMALSLNPHDPVSLQMRGMTHAALGELQPALDDLSSSINEAPNEAKSHIIKAKLYARMDQSDGVIAETDILSKLHAMTEVTYYLRGVAEGRIDDDVSAAADFSKALEIVPDYEPAHEGLEVVKKRLIEKQHPTTPSGKMKDVETPPKPSSSDF